MFANGQFIGTEKKNWLGFTQEQYRSTPPNPENNRIKLCLVVVRIVRWGYMLNIGPIGLQDWVALMSKPIALF